MTNDYAIFAARQGLGPDVAYVLPALFDHAAQKVGMHVRALLAEATYRNPALGEHMAGLARTVAAQQ